MRDGIFLGCYEKRDIVNIQQLKPLNRPKKPKRRQHQKEEATGSSDDMRKEDNFGSDFGVDKEVELNPAGLSCGQNSVDNIGPFTTEKQSN